MMRKTAVCCALAGLLLMCGSAGALTITDLDTGELMNGPWLIENDATVAGDPSNWMIHVGTDNEPSSEADSQPTSWHAVGKELPSNNSGYLVEFDYDLWTFDRMDYDTFGVSLNPIGLLWNLDLPELPDDAGSPWPGVTWWDGGSDYPGIEHLVGADSIVGSGQDIYLTVFLSTGIGPHMDSIYASWGAFNDEATPPTDIPEPATLVMLALAGAGLALRKRLVG